MAKELPFFKFHPSAWENGKIQLCSRQSKGLFTDLCSAYWTRQGELPYAFALHKHCNSDASLMQELINNEVIIIEDEQIIIEFLDEQLSEFIEIGKKRADAANKRWNAKAMQVQCKSNARREEKRREEINISFDVFWEAYDKKEDRVKCEKKWKGLTNAEREACITAVPVYVQSTPDKKFRKNPATYLNNKSWTNEIITKPSTSQARAYVPPKTPSYINPNYVQPV
jgi:hypothetical protein